MAAVPASQVDLGVAGYGYAVAAGRPTTGLRRGRPGAGRHAGPGPRPLGGEIGEWTAKLPTAGRLVVGRPHLALRERLAASLGLHGLAVGRWACRTRSDPPAPPTAD